MSNLKAIIMKHFVLAVFTVALALAGYSQAEMPVVWEQDMGIKYCS